MGRSINLTERVNEKIASHAATNQRAALHVARQEAMQEYMRQYGLNFDDSYWENGSGYTLYENGRGTVRLVKTSEETAVDGNLYLQIEDDAPGSYVSFDLEKNLSDLKLKCYYLENKEPHSEEYKQLNAAFQDLNDIRIGGNPDLDTVKNASNKFAFFQSCLKKFIKLYQDKPAPISKETYAENIDLLSKFADNKLFALNKLACHIETERTAGLDGREIEAAIDSAKNTISDKPAAPDLLVTYTDCATKYFKMMAPLVDAEYQADLNKEPFAGLSEMFRTINSPEVIALEEDLNAKTDKECLRTLLGDEIYNKAVDGTIRADELTDRLGKIVLACSVVEQLMKLEGSFQNEEDRTIQNLVNAGKVTEIIGLVERSQSFGDEIRPLDLSDGNADHLATYITGGENQKSVPKQVAKDIMKSYLDRQRQVAAEKKMNQKGDMKKPNPEVNKGGAQKVK